MKAGAKEEGTSSAWAPLLFLHSELQDSAVSAPLLSDGAQQPQQLIRIGR